MAASPFHHKVQRAPARSVLARLTSPLLPTSALRPVPMKAVFRFAVFAFVSPLASSFLLLARAIVVLFLELAVRLQPLIQVVVHVANVIATSDVDLTRALMDFCKGWPVLACFFRHARPSASWHVLSFRGQARCFHSLVILIQKVPLTSIGRGFRFCRIPSGNLRFHDSSHSG